MFDWIIQEIDIATGKVIWEWHALGHVPLTDCYDRYSPGQPYDYFHLNSIQQLPGGRILISARHTWAVYSIEKKTGKIAWGLGGKHSNFKMGTGTNFEWQHDAIPPRQRRVDPVRRRRDPQGGDPVARAGAPRHAHQATLIHAYTHKPPAWPLSRAACRSFRTTTSSSTGA